MRPPQRFIEPAEGEDYVGIFRTLGLRGIKQDPDWEEWHKYTDPSVKWTGEVGKLENIRFIESNHSTALSKVGLSSVLGEGVVFGADAVAMAEVATPELRAAIPQDWPLGKPDLVLEMPEPFPVEAAGRDRFRCFVLPTGLTEDRVVVGFDYRPGAPTVVHHALFFLDTQQRARKLDEKDEGPGYETFGGIGFLPSGGLGGYAPEGPGSANYNNLIDPDATDPISGTVALRSYLCQVRRGEP